MRGVAQVGMMLAALGLTVAAAQAPAGLARYATMKPGEQSRPWDDAVFKRALTQALKPKAALARLYYSGPVIAPSRRIGDTQVVWACRAHDCSSVQAYVYIEPKKNRLSVCWRDDDTPKAAAQGADWWLAAGRPPERLADHACGADDRADAAFRAHAAP